jgi:hypothetical protein
MKITDYVHQHFKKHSGPIRPHIVMNDGTTLSVQASQYHYCEPRLDNYGNYDTVEVYNWPIGETFFNEYGGDDDAGFVPVGVVNFYIEKHGGVIEEF